MFTYLLLQHRSLYYSGTLSNVWVCAYQQSRTHPWSSINTSLNPPLHIVPLVNLTHYLAIFCVCSGNTMPPGCELYIFNCYIYCDLCLIIKKLVYSYIETVSLKVTHLDPKHKRCFIWKVNYCHCYLCSPYLRRAISIGSRPLFLFQPYM